MGTDAPVGLTHSFLPLLNCTSKRKWQSPSVSKAGQVHFPQTFYPNEV